MATNSTSCASSKEGPLWAVSLCPIPVCEIKGTESRLESSPTNHLHWSLWTLPVTWLSTGVQSMFSKHFRLGTASALGKWRKGHGEPLSLFTLFVTCRHRFTHRVGTHWVELKPLSGSVRIVVCESRSSHVKRVLTTHHSWNYMQLHLGNPTNKQ